MTQRHLLFKSCLLLFCFVWGADATKSDDGQKSLLVPRALYWRRLLRNLLRT